MAAEHIPHQAMEWTSNGRRKEVNLECLDSTPWKETQFYRIVLGRSGTVDQRLSFVEKQYCPYVLHMGGNKN